MSDWHPNPPKRKESKRRARPETILTKPAEGLSYAEVLEDLKSKVKQDILDVKIRGVIQTKN